MISSYIHSFPDKFTPTSIQVDTISKIESAFKGGKKFVICCAPTGSGKSPIAKTFDGVSKTPTEKFKELINNHEAFTIDGFTGEFKHADKCLAEGPAGSFVLTITKSLQDQYQEMFEEIPILKGKSNYECDINGEVSVEDGPCVLSKVVKETCLKNNNCPYYNARKVVLTSRFSALNYSMFLSLPDHVKYKNFIICDEASELEGELVKRYSAEIDVTKLNKNDIDCDTPKNIYPENVRPWIIDLVAELEVAIDKLKTRLSKGTRPPTAGEFYRLKYFTNMHRSLSQVLKNWDDVDYIIEREKKVIKLTPLKVDKLASNIFEFGERILLMSATIIDHKNFAKTLGITEYEYIEAPSQFDPVKSPIYVSSRYKLNYSNLEKSLPDVISQIEKICEHHKKDKGIIHTHTQTICDKIKDRVGKNDRFLFRSEESTNEDLLFEHCAVREPTVLVSPSLSFGVDLKDDLARFQIIVKLPYLPLSDKRIKKLFDLDKDWYEDRMLNTLVQAAGRATRGINDHSITYILDGCIVDVLGRAKHKLPKHFIDRIH